MEGFRVLYEKVGYFDITEEMIFMDKMGRVKVWMNPNLSKNYPYYERSDISFSPLSQKGTVVPTDHGSQSDMLKALINLI